VLTIVTSAVVVQYTVGQPFSPSTLTVSPVSGGSTFKGWAYGDPFPGNLLGTIRGLDVQVWDRRLFLCMRGCCGTCVRAYVLCLPTFVFERVARVVRACHCEVAGMCMCV
jgi:hypothetical protein